MKRAFLSGLILLSILLAGGSWLLGQSANASASCSVPEATRIAQQIVAAWQEGYNSGHADQVAALYADDAYYLTQHFASGIVHGRVGIRAYVQRGINANYHIDSLQILSVDCSGDMFYAITRYDATNAGQKAFGVNLVVVKKEAGQWRIVAHEAAVPDPATAIQRLDQ